MCLSTPPLPHLLVIAGRVVIRLLIPAARHVVGLEGELRRLHGALHPQGPLVLRLKERLLRSLREPFRGTWLNEFSVLAPGVRL